MSLDVGLLIFRVLFGGAIAAHGAQKLFGWFGGYGLKGTGGFFEQLGFKPGTAFAGAAGLSEFGGGLLLLFGFFTPVGAAVVLATMLVAAISVHIKNGFFAMTNGVEAPFLYAAAALGIAFTGSGTISLDALLGLTRLSQPAIVVTVLFISILGAGVSLAFRRPAQDAVAEP